MKGHSTLPAFDKLEIFPIGSIYTSINSTSPATLFGGTWTQIQGRFLLSASSSYAAGGTGGASTVNLSHVHSTAAIALTEAQIPSHRHTHPNNGHTFSWGDTSSTLWLNSGQMEARSASNNGLTSYQGTNNYTNYTGSSQAHSHGNTGSNLSSSQSIMPPYLVVYMWQRTG